LELQTSSAFGVVIFVAKFLSSKIRENENEVVRQLNGMEVIPILTRNSGNSLIHYFLIVQINGLSAFYCHIKKRFIVPFYMCFLVAFVPHIPALNKCTLHNKY